MRFLFIFLLSAGLILTGCSSPEPKAVNKAEGSELKQKEGKKEEKKEQWWKKKPEYYEIDEPRELTNVEGLLLRKEGDFIGKNYHFSTVKEKLDELPKGLTTGELSEAILHLIQEDYHQELETFLHFDPTVRVDVDSPDETIKEPEAEAAASHFAILLDASGSMNAKNKSGTRMDEAKAAIESFMGYLPENSTVSLRVYGHKGSGSDADKKLSCGATETIYQGEASAEKMKGALSKVKPAGWTPIGKALADVKADIPNDASSAIVYVVSDGIETCDGDPVAEAKKLSSEGIQPIINIIGFQVDNEAQQLLKKVAEAGNGEFTYAGSKQELDKYWRGEYDRLQEAWEEWKREGMRLAEEKKRELMGKAEETGRLIMDKAETEFSHAEEIIDYLREKEIAENGNQLWSEFYGRKNKIWSYGYSTKNKNWSEAYGSGNKVWSEFYGQGNKKWIEYYNKKNQH